MSSELCTFYIVRHFDKVTSRIDGNFPGCFTEGEIKNYYDNNYDTNPNILINPYICDNNNKRLTEIAKKLKDIKIDYVFSSPFLRTIQTALDLINFKIEDKYGINIENRELFIDFGLSEIFDSLNFLPGRKKPTSIDINSIYKNSMEFFCANDKKRKAYTHNNIILKNAIPLIITSLDNNTRFINTFTNLQKCPEYIGKKIIIITHGASLTNWYSETYSKKPQYIDLNYGDVYRLQNLALTEKPKKITLEIEKSKYEQKYIKYKTKYLMLKTNNKKL
jgi:hypothetical protein